MIGMVCESLNKIIEPPLTHRSRLTKYHSHSYALCFLHMRCSCVASTSRYLAIHPWLSILGSHFVAAAVEVEASSTDYLVYVLELSQCIL